MCSHLNCTLPQLFQTYSPNCVISSVQLNGFCCQSEGSVTFLVILQEGAEIVINIWDWCRHTPASTIKVYPQRSLFKHIFKSTGDGGSSTYGWGFCGHFLFISFSWTPRVLHFVTYTFQSRRSGLQDEDHHPGGPAPDLPIPSCPWNTKCPAWIIRTPMVKNTSSIMETLCHWKLKLTITLCRAGLSFWNIRFI